MRLSVLPPTLHLLKSQTHIHPNQKKKDPLQFSSVSWNCFENIDHDSRKEHLNHWRRRTQEQPKISHVEILLIIWTRLFLNLLRPPWKVHLIHEIKRGFFYRHWLKHNGNAERSFFNGNINQSSLPNDKESSWCVSRGDKLQKETTIIGFNRLPKNNPKV